MVKKSLLLVIAVFFLSASFCFSQSKNNLPQEDSILTTTENLFQFMKTRNYAAIWENISIKTRKIIIGDVQKAVKKKTGNGLGYTEVEKDFVAGGALAKSYWDSYLSVFDPEIVLLQSKWAMGKIEKNEAEVILHYKKSEKPAVIKIFRENDAWRVGLEETFGTRRLNPF